MAEAGLAAVEADGALAPPDEFQRALDALALIVGDNLDHPVGALAVHPVRPTGLVDTAQPIPSTAEQSASAIARFQALAT